MAIGEGALLFDQSHPCIFNRRPDETAWAVGSIQKELSKAISRSKNTPLDWATPDQRCRAAIKAVGNTVR